MLFTSNYPKNIVCLTEETTETLYAIGADELIVGITQYTVRPPEAKLQKPIVARYIDAKIDDILELKPDLVIAWSNIQANIVADLIKQGVEVMCFNHHTINGILSMILKLGSLIGKTADAEKYIAYLIEQLQNARKIGDARSSKPKVYFEEWYNPIILGSHWISEIIEICGGETLFSDKCRQYDARNRIITNSNEIIEADPDIILASWCGAPFKKGRMLRRERWNEITAVKNDMLFHIDSAIILQPGPASITDGINIINTIFDEWEAKTVK